MRRGQCFRCTSRRCSTRIHTSLARAGGPVFDEVACVRHTSDLEEHADQVLDGQLRTNVSSSGSLSRGAAGGLPGEERRLVAIGEALQRLDRPGDRPRMVLDFDNDRGVKRWQLSVGLKVLGSGVFLWDAIIEAARRRSSAGTWWATVSATTLLPDPETTS